MLPQGRCIVVIGIGGVCCLGKIALDEQSCAEFSCCRFSLLVKVAQPKIITGYEERFAAGGGAPQTPSGPVSPLCCGHVWLCMGTHLLRCYQPSGKKR
eukprot:scaffold5773_cov36-Tisochrysis_lutea.AAC.4